jgi:hypothetical protein
MRLLPKVASSLLYLSKLRVDQERNLHLSKKKLMSITEWYL